MRQLWARIAKLLVLLALFAGGGTLSAASISGPTSNTTGAFTLTWTPGYHLRLADSQWAITTQASNATSYNFSNLPSGQYKFQLWHCWDEIVWYSGEWGVTYDTVTFCAADATALHTVSVTRDAEPAISAASAAGSMAYDTGVSMRGAATIDIPLKTYPGSGTLSIPLTVRYDSSREVDRIDNHLTNDSLGYGWYLDGLPIIQRCLVGTTDYGYPTYNNLGYGATDRLCLNGEPLVAYSGAYWAANTVYRTERQSWIKVTGKLSGTAQWYEVRYPDGRVANLDIKVRPGGRPDLNGNEPQAYDPYIWATSKMYNPTTGDEWTATYDIFDGYGTLVPREINHAGAKIEFKYGARIEGPTSKPVANHKRHSVLNRIVVSYNGTSGWSPVREYRFDSDDSTGRTLLSRIQECGYERNASAGATPSCLKPLTVTWVISPVQGPDQYPVVVSALTSGSTASITNPRTLFTYASVSTSSNPLTYSQNPFGTASVPSGYMNFASAVVQVLRQSNGLGAAGLSTWNYAYKGLGLRNSTRRGFVGFQERREHDAQAGSYEYAQQRLDFPFIGLVSASARFEGGYSASARELARTEIGYAKPTHQNYPYAARRIDWAWVKGPTTSNTLVSVTKTVTAPCFGVTTPAGTCDTSAGLQESMSSAATSVTVGNLVSSPIGAPAFWGDIPDRTVSGIVHRTTVSELFSSDYGEWHMHFVQSKATTSEELNPSTSTVLDTKTVTQSFNYTSDEILSGLARFPGDASLQTVTSNAYAMVGTLKRPSTSTTTTTNSGSSRTSSIGLWSSDGRVPLMFTNALSQTTTASASDIDNRFATLARIPDVSGRYRELDLDPFGRTVRVKETDLTELHTTYQECTSSICPTEVQDRAAMKITVETRFGGVSGARVAPTQTTYVDVLGREVLSETGSFGGSSHRVRTEFDAIGRMQYVTKPYLPGGTSSCTQATSANVCTWFTYDDAFTDRVRTSTGPDGYVRSEEISAVSSGSITLRTSDGITTQDAIVDGLGRIAQTVDGKSTGGSTALEITTAFSYDAHNNLRKVAITTPTAIDPAGTGAATYTVYESVHDAAGNLVRQFDSNYGATTSTCSLAVDSCVYRFAYNGYGELLSRTDPKGQQSTYTYDALGRLTRRADVGRTHEWVWDTSELGALAIRRTLGVYSETYTYDPADGSPTRRVIAIDSVGAGIAAQNVTFDYTYDSTTNRLLSVTSPDVSMNPSGGVVERHYSTSGYLDYLSSGATTLQDVVSTDAFGAVSQATVRGPGKTAYNVYRTSDANTGRPVTLKVGTTPTTGLIQNDSYTWRADGSLLQRNNALLGAVDTFTYDSLNRVSSQSTTFGASTRQRSFGYHRSGVLASNTSTVSTDLQVSGGLVSYGQSRPHRLANIQIGGALYTLVHDANGSVTSYTSTTGGNRYMTYDGDGRLKSIQTEATASAPTYPPRDEFWYDGDGNRIVRREQWTDAGTLRERNTYYLGDGVERVVDPASGVVAETAQHSDMLRYVVTPAFTGFEFNHADHLGSSVVTTRGSVSAPDVMAPRMAFDPFGLRRASNWLSDITSGEMGSVLAQQHERTGRGFTGHEMLDRTLVVHMNGRVFDPRIGQFLSIDPIISEPYTSQGWNPYSYVRNRPMSMVDPSGYDPDRCCGFDWGSALGSFGALEAVREPWFLSAEMIRNFEIGLSYNAERETERLQERQRQQLFVLNQMSVAGTCATNPNVMNIQSQCAAVAAAAAAAAAQGAFYCSSVDGQSFCMAVPGSQATMDAVMKGEQQGTLIGGGIVGLIMVAGPAVGGAIGPQAIVLGESGSYRVLASQIGARTLSIPNAARMTRDEIIAINKAFLDEAVSKGRRIIFSTHPSAASVEKFFQWELEYLAKRGYVLVRNGWEMVPGW